MTSFQHQPVLLRESIDVLDLRPGMTVVDCTAGGGGHSRLILEKILPEGMLVAVDQDPQALEATEERLSEVCANQGRKPYVTVHSNFSRIKGILAELGINGVDRAFMDLGPSSYQLDEGTRGFSYQHKGDLDMRMDPTSDALTAYEIVMQYSAQELEQIIRRFGEERWCKRIAQRIVEEREKEAIQTTDQLVRVIKKAIPAGAREEGPHPAKRTFQAIRIYINKELDVLGPAITDTVDTLHAEGRLAVISFHSLEDRIVKDTFKKLTAECVCPKDFPVCVCGKVRQGRILTTKPVLPGAAEIKKNPRSRSAKLRAFQKI
ncbi:MAG: 16S rRNA (cytosine(1402)-N(4))-methyltransferase RsmH [Clostridiales bacterium]|nr:16S rRNA (cytosine(1402)-N(4))-methyltransferase RsmH [Clostridiales bacterium]